MMSSPVTSGGMPNGLACRKWYMVSGILRNAGLDSISQMLLMQKMPSAKGLLMLVIDNDPCGNQVPLEVPLMGGKSEKPQNSGIYIGRNEMLGT